jgi:hypothetical protein
MTQIFHGFARALVLGPDDLEAWESLQALVAQGQPQPSMDLKSRDELIRYLDGSAGRAYGIFESGELIAGALMRVPTHEAPMPPGGFPLLSQSAWSQHTGFLESAMVAPAARGRGHQLALIHARRTDARQLGLHWLATGVRAGNNASWLNLIRGGLSLVGHRQNADGTDILALLGSLGRERLSTDANNFRYVHRADATGHRKALQEGYVGVWLYLNDLVVYERFINAAYGN